MECHNNKKKEYIREIKVSTHPSTLTARSKIIPMKFSNYLKAVDK